MGNNAAYSNFEGVIIAIYDKGVLDADLLESICEVFRDQDADSGDVGDVTAKDGLNLYEILIKVSGKEIPQKPDLPANYRDWTPEQDAANDNYHEAVHALVNEITKF